MAEKVTVISKWEDWTEEVKGYSEIKRGDKTIKVPIRSITQEELDEINARCKIPSPPRVFVKEKKTWVDDPNNPEYLEKVEKINQRRSLLLTLAFIDMEIPGKDDDEKIANLVKKLPGDILTIMRDGMKLSNLMSDEELKEEAKND